ncbi:MAG: hypothetical protein R3D69_08975 [Xanthobacteraceae bacterium]
MPLLQFFSFAGAALLALLFVADSTLPKSAERQEAPRFYNIRIAADRVGPEAVTFSGNPVHFAIAEAVATAPTLANVSPESSKSPRDAMAQLTSASDAPAVEPAKPAKRKPVKRRVRTQEPADTSAGWTRPTHTARTAGFFFNFN